MGGIILAWLAGQGIIVYRSVARDHAPPVPGQMLAATGLFALLAVLAEYEPARAAATALAFGVDLAVLMQVLPGTKPQGKAKPKPKTNTGTGKVAQA